MKTNYLIKSTTSLRVKRPSPNVYLVWIQNYQGLVPPKLQYEVDEDQEIRLTKITGQIKGIAINSFIFGGVVILTILLIENGNFNLKELLPFLLGIIGFMILLNFLVIESTKWKVKKQIKKTTRHKA